MRRHCHVTVISLAASLGFSTLLWGSIDRGAIRGTVTDQQGAVVAGARIVVKNADTNVQLNLATNIAGFFLAPQLVPGTYSVYVLAQGFAPVDVTKVEVKPNDIATVDVRLELSRTAQHIQVTAANPLVETTSENFSVPIEQHYMQELPILGRDIQSLTQLIPGVTQSVGPPGTLVGVNGGEFGGFPDPTHIVGSEIAVNGSQASANTWYLDGSLNSAEGMDNVVVNPPPDAVGEFQAVTNAFAAEYGRNAGAVFNIVLRSGTNDFHGDVYEYNRNSYFEARNPFAPTDPFGKVLPPNFVNWNQFGGTIGGPVDIPHVYQGKNRTFFFAGWDVSLLHEKGSRLFTVPTLLERQGNFSEFPAVQQFGLYDPLTTKYDASLGYFTRQPFTNRDGTLATSIPTNRFDPVASWFLGQYPTPNFLDPRQQNAAAGGCLNTCNNYQGTYGSGQTTHSVVAKVDHQISENNKLFVEWLYNPTSYSLIKLPWTGATVPLVGFNGSFPFDVKNHIATLGDTHTFGPSLVNEFRLSYSRQSDVPQPVPNSLQDTTGTLQHIQGLNIPVHGPLQPTPIIGIRGLAFFGPQFNNLIQTTQAATVMDNVTKIISNHSIKAGFMFRTDLTGTEFPTETFLGFGRASALTANPATGAGGNAVAQFLLGAVDQGDLYTAWVRYIASSIGSNHTWSFYVQDDYRVTPKLTLNYGLRYDMYGWADDRHNNGSLFNFNAPNPLVPTRLGRVVYLGTPQHPSSRMYPANKGDLGPRINFAYTPFRDRKTVVRGGIDLIFFNGNTMALGQGTGVSETTGYAPWFAYNTDATGQGLIASNQVPSFILSKGAPNITQYTDPKSRDDQELGPSSGGVALYYKQSGDPTMALWNLQIQRELPQNMVLSIGYTGSKGTYLQGGSGNFNHVPTAISQKYRSQLNQLVPMPADLAPIYGQNYYKSQLFLPYPEWPAGYVGSIGTGVGGSSDYDGLQVKLEKRYSHGLNFLAAYSWQKTIGSEGLGGFFSNTWTGGPSPSSGRGRILQVNGAVSGTLAQDPDNRRGDRGLAPDDIPQIFNMAATWELPLGPGKLFASRSAGISRLLVEGWKISGNLNAQRGVPLNFTGPCNPLTCRPNLIGDPNSGRGSKTRYQQEQQWFNPNAFEAVFGSDPAIINLATNGTPTQQDQYNEFWRFGTAGEHVGSGRTPGFWNADISLAKDFRISETKAFQFRAEAYNILNHQNLGVPNTGWCLPPNADGSTDAVHQFGCQFGRITGTQTDPRGFQFGLKFLF